ncbi:hypothetical protein [Pseudoalteromonas ulvae]|uniref:Uncharacterized protein n=1 Tax=Pseudoalteromonas ulvae TaxID=107327 RepID=A0A244CM76_PSEDV|nr:hypothetical protein [Pseudoalteromonas ulvae]OUL56616.1 hypothetical protein B1199_18330 [Pseudoalteromonas ulvae]
MDTYNPNKEVDSESWLALDEDTRIDLVHDFHSGLDLELAEDGLQLHSSIHVIVENQLAMEVDLLPETIAKLTRQGLNRHEAIHAIGAIITEDIFDVMKGNTEEFSPKKYRRKLQKLTAKRWLKGQY